MSATAGDRPRIELSWVLPLYRTAAQLDELVARIDRVSAALRLRHEVILVDDACPEGSGGLALRKADLDPHLRVLRLSPNQGQDRALIAGLRLSRGEWTVVLDADLQDPPEAMAELWPLCTAAHDAVFARRTGNYSSRGRQATSRCRPDSARSSGWKRGRARRKRAHSRKTGAPTAARPRSSPGIATTIRRCDRAILARN